MIAIKDTTVTVQLGSYLDKYYWVIHFDKETGISPVASTCGYNNFKHKSSAKRNWVKFASINNITDWRYV